MDSTFVPTIEREYGRNALPNLFDAKAKDPSSRPYAYVMRSPNPEDGFDTVTYSMMANAINRASWWLVNEVELAEGEVFAYLGPSDLRYVFLFMAAAKTGRQVSHYLPPFRDAKI
jgi:acyl-coenzyme A synthetase/AMP-(fatty) acid ligase